MLFRNSILADYKDCVVNSFSASIAKLSASFEVAHAFACVPKKEKQFWQNLVT